MTKKLAIIGASYLQLPLVKKAKELGMEVHCFAWEDGSVCKEYSDYFYPISIVEKEDILQVCRKVHIDGVCTIASDVAAPTVAYVAENMNLIANSYDAAVRANNKYFMRNAFIDAGIPCPKYIMVTSKDEIEISGMSFPLIVKPTDRSGSLGVTKVLSLPELYDAVDLALSVSFRKQAMIEEFIEGREISVEFISFKGVHYPLQITDKITTGAPCFVELEHHQPAEFSSGMYDWIYSLTSMALDSLGLTNGASHSEYKITRDGKVYVMEIGGRMGGDFIGSDLVVLSTGYDFIRGVIDVALGSFTKPMFTKKKHSGVFFLCKETERLLTLFEKGCDNKDIVMSEITDETLRNVRCSADRSGYLIYCSDKRMAL